jgi:hypothetical protein
VAKIKTALIDPGKPWQNGADESFNGNSQHWASRIAARRRSSPTE